MLYPLQESLLMKNVPNCALLAVLITGESYRFCYFQFWVSKPFSKHSGEDDSNIVRIDLPFKDQVSASAVRRQLRDLSHKIGPTLQPVFISKKLEHDLKPKKTSRQWSISSALFTILYLICAMKIMSATLPDTFFNVLLNTKIWQSENIMMMRIVGATFWMRTILRFLESAKADLIVKWKSSF